MIQFNIEHSTFFFKEQEIFKYHISKSVFSFMLRNMMANKYVVSFGVKSYWKKKNPRKKSNNLRLERLLRIWNVTEFGMTKDKSNRM